MTPADRLRATITGALDALDLDKPEPIEQLPNESQEYRLRSRIAWTRGYLTAGLEAVPGRRRKAQLKYVPVTSRLARETTFAEDLQGMLGAKWPEQVASILRSSGTSSGSSQAQPGGR